MTWLHNVRKCGIVPPHTPLVGWYGIHGTVSIQCIILYMSQLNEVGKCRVLPLKHLPPTFLNKVLILVCTQVCEVAPWYSIYILILPSWHSFTKWSTHILQPNFARPCFLTLVPPYQQSILVSILWQYIIRNVHYQQYTVTINNTNLPLSTVNSCQYTLTINNTHPPPTSILVICPFRNL